jgi:nicotinamidase-related amidase
MIHKGEMIMKKTLIVIDMQNDFIDSALGTKEAQAIVPNVKKKIEEYKSRGDEIIFTRDTHYDNYLETNEGRHLPIKHCINKTYGWCVHDDLDEVDYLHIDKESFGYNSWDLWIDRDTESIEIVGLVLNICVISNAIILKSFFPNTTITVDLSCTAATSDQDFDAAVRVLNSCHIDTIK